MFCLSESSFRIDNLVRGAMGEAHGPPSLERANPEARGAESNQRRRGGGEGCPDSGRRRGGSESAMGDREEKKEKEKKGSAEYGSSICASMADYY